MSLVPGALRVFCAWCRRRECINGSWQSCREQEYNAARPISSHGICPACLGAYTAKRERDRRRKADHHLSLERPNVDNLDRIKLALGGLAALLGAWWGSLALAVQILLILQALDVASGLLAGWYRRELCSRIGVRGLIPKALVWVLIAAVAAVTPVLGDLAAVVLPVVGQVSPAVGVAFYFAAIEFLSLVENLHRAGVPIPAFIADRLAQFQPPAGSVPSGSPGAPGAQP